ncbi:hypothetical protein M378DRAFT_11126 [Amanita muscaria Koide BX008]|uniref:Nephrocystin 3-like N-terminal domain-containing protein n=1 Tax=Amanita muscaria (strain Koide BX008) TaxID=946122 RepID=A0A0C2TDZ5_AMAMK|nr:hypothetical protein M378DRAFT_11126 [Amanita muscaria Koide BX008]
MEKTHPSSVDHLAVEGSYTRGLPSTVTSPEAPNVATFNDNQDSHTPYQNRWDSAPNTASMFSSAQRFNISGQPHFVNIANINQLSNLGGSQGLENFQKSVSPNALYDSSAQELDSQVQQSLRKNTLKQLQDWTDNPIVTEHIIWLNGSASIGKTAIALDIAWTRREKVAATFFFSRTDANRNDGNRLFPTLAWQFIVSIPDIKKHIIHSINERPDLPNKGVEAQFEYLIAQPFAAMKETTSAVEPSPSDLVVIIDGIDECVDIRLQRRILKVIGNAIQDPRVSLRFIISSRPDAHIQETFHQFQFPIFCIDLAKFSPAEEIRKREEEIRTREEEIRKREEEIRKREEEIRTREEEIGKREEEVGKREESKEEEEIGKRAEEVGKREEEVGKREEEITQREEEIREREEEIGKREEETRREAQALDRLRVRFLSDVSPITTRPSSRQQDRPDDDMNDSQRPESALSGISMESSREASRIGIPQIVRWLHNVDQEALLSPFERSESPELRPYVPVIPVATQPPGNSYQRPNDYIYPRRELQNAPHVIVPLPDNMYPQFVPQRWAKRR